MLRLEAEGEGRVSVGLRAQGLEDYARVGYETPVVLGVTSAASTTPYSPNDRRLKPQSLLPALFLIS